MKSLPDINIDQTKKNARKVLKQYRILNRIAGRSLTSVKSPVLNGMPKNTNTNSIQENKSVQVVNASMELEEIDRAVNNLPQEYIDVIYYKYMSKETHTNLDIAGLVFGSITANKTVARRLSDGLLLFSESYRNGELLV
ncbi:ArpU family phage packaging/lysis transcriptional regulator [Companilactobacillus futsaii]|uniref:ArpU family transcriptional regulator n=1 Tax=Companilactobacillus futsaii JCM 17355 TaxID=1423818 RepID=A0ABR5P660_9LACO|nr:ArpU family phage packaging/lysis transcriptional regulator [Companilactobacillus futsaii]KRK93354.1 hypothetical protein FC88_GL000332 [Companilactobacillus futsaii JCM 17355]